jgi:hypothetical protein
MVPEKGMEPQVYLYKITFEEIPDWYWGVHKENHPGEYYMGSPYTHAWKWEFYTPKKQILQYFEFSAEGYREAKLIEDRLIRPDLNNPLCLNENVGGQYSIVAAALGAYAVHQEKDENGKSKHAVMAGRNRAAITNAKKDLDGKCIAGKNLAAKTHAKKDDQGRSLVAMATVERLNSIKDERGKSLAGVKGAAKVNSTMYYDPDHPELGHKSAPTLASMQKNRGYPHGPENRRRVYPPDTEV